MDFEVSSLRKIKINLVYPKIAMAREQKIESMKQLIENMSNLIAYYLVNGYDMKQSHLQYGNTVELNFTDTYPRPLQEVRDILSRYVEELSARLMHTIVDIRSIENGRIILEEPNKDRVINPLEVRCIYLEQLLAGKDLVKNPGRCNVYIEDANSTK